VTILVRGLHSLPNIETKGQVTNNLNDNDKTVLNEARNQGQHQAIAMTIDKSVYSRVVNITARNIGAEPQTFPNAALGLRIENSKYLVTNRDI